MVKFFLFMINFYKSTKVSSSALFHTPTRPHQKMASTTSAVAKEKEKEIPKEEGEGLEEDDEFEEFEAGSSGPVFHSN